MTVDIYGFEHANGREGIAHFEAATHAALGYRTTGAQSLKAAVAQDVNHVGAHALAGLSMVVQARADLQPLIWAAHTAAWNAAAQGASADEMTMLEALDLAIAGQLAAAADRLDTRRVGQRPALLLVKLANMLRFQLGDPAGMARGTVAALQALPQDATGYGYILGCQAFALEELGAYHAGEVLGRQALGCAPDDVWAIHAVAHTFEMRGQTQHGIAWLEERRSIWKQSGSFGFHSAWHLALFHLELSHYDHVLELYDADIRPSPTLEVRDVANGVAMLWRLRQAGVDVGARWEELAEIARMRLNDTSSIFFTLHNILALLAVRDWQRAETLVAAIDRERCGSRDQSAVARQIGSKLAHALLNIARRSGSTCDITDLATQLQPLGGSTAQRDVFVRILAVEAAEKGYTTALDSIVAARRALKSIDRFDQMLIGMAGRRFAFI